MELSAWLASGRAGIVGLGSGRGEASWWDDGGGRPLGWTRKEVEWMVRIAMERARLRQTKVYGLASGSSLIKVVEVATLRMSAMSV